MKLKAFIDPDKVTVFDADVSALSSKERFLRAGKGGGVFLIAAVLALPIPVVHLILVPVGLFLSIFVFVWKYSHKILINFQNLPCPSCKELQVYKGGISEWPLRCYCSKCRAQFLVRE